MEYLSGCVHVYAVRISGGRTPLCFFQADQVKKYLGTGRIRPVILAALFGIPIPLCSCGVVPVASGLKKQGANSGAALSFGCYCTGQSCWTDVGPLISPFSLGSRLRKGIRYAYGDLLTDIAKPFLIGILIAGAITFFFPEDLTLWANEHRFTSMIVMLIAGIPMYVCATSSTPVAAALILKGLNPGAGHQCRHHQYR